jgi:hypothetical protein
LTTWSKPRVERSVQYVRGNFFAGEDFVDLADAQARVEKWCRDTAGQRIHGTTQTRPAEMFAESEAAALLGVPEPYDVPIFTQVKVHRDFHIEVGKALYSAPKVYIGQYLDVRADSALVKLFHRGQLVKVHPRQRPGGRWTDPEDLPSEKTGYALRDLDRLIATARQHGPDVGIYAERLLDDRLGVDQDAAGLPAARASPALRRRPGSTPPAGARSNSTSCPSRRSPPCWRRRVRTRPSRPRRRRRAVRRVSPVTRPSSAPTARV